MDKKLEFLHPNEYNEAPTETVTAAYWSSEKLCEPNRQIMTCPFNPQHKFKACRLISHIMKCEKQHPNHNKVPCLYNVLEYIDADTNEEHFKTCIYRKNIDFNFVNLNFKTTPEIIDTNYYQNKHTINEKSKEITNYEDDGSEGNSCSYEKNLNSSTCDDDNADNQESSQEISDSEANDCKIFSKYDKPKIKIKNITNLTQFDNPTECEYIKVINPNGDETKILKTDIENKTNQTKEIHSTHHPTNQNEKLSDDINQIVNTLGRGKIDYENNAHMPKLGYNQNGWYHNKTIPIGRGDVLKQLINQNKSRCNEFRNRTCLGRGELLNIEINKPGFNSNLKTHIYMNNSNQNQGNCLGNQQSNHSQNMDRLPHSYAIGGPRVNISRGRGEVMKEILKRQL